MTIHNFGVAALLVIGFLVAVVIIAGMIRD